jgi:hypothetical protein
MTIGQDLHAVACQEAQSPISSALAALSEAIDDTERMGGALETQLSTVLSSPEPQSNDDSAKCAGGVSSLEESILCKVRQLRRVNEITKSVLHRLQL